MPTGLKVPVRVDQSGGAAIEKNEVENTKKLLFLALSEGGDNNPFQALGIQGDLVFGLNNPAFRARAQRALEIILEKYADRVQLAPDTAIKFETGDVQGETVMTFEYVDITVDKVEEFQMKFVKGSTRT